MKTIKVYSRVVLKRTGYRKYPYKESKEISIFYNGQEIYNHCNSIDNPKLKIPFTLDLKTRSKKSVENFISNLRRISEDVWLKQKLIDILESEVK